MTIADMSQPSNSNYGPPNGFIPFNQNESSWRDSSHWLQPPMFGATTTIPVFGSWKPSNDHALNHSVLSQPVSECVILDEDPHQPRGIRPTLLPPPPPPPTFASIYQLVPPPPLPPKDIYFFNPPPSNSHLQSKSDSDMSLSPSPSENPNFDQASKTPSNTHTPVHFNNEEDVLSSPEPQRYSENEPGRLQFVESSQKPPNEKSHASRISNHPEPYSPGAPSSPSISRYEETPRHHRSLEEHRENTSQGRHRSVDRYRERSPLHRDYRNRSRQRSKDRYPSDRRDSSRRHRDSEERRPSSKRYQDNDKGEIRDNSRRYKDFDGKGTRDESKRRKDFDNEDDDRGSKRRSLPERRRRSRSVSRSRRRDDRLSKSERRKDKSPSRPSHSSTKHSSSSRKTTTHPNLQGESQNSMDLELQAFAQQNGDREEILRKKLTQRNNFAQQQEESQNSMDLQLQAFAQELGDPEEILRKKLHQKMIEKLKKTAHTSNEKSELPSNLKSHQPNGNVRLYYDVPKAARSRDDDEDSEESSSSSESEPSDENNPEEGEENVEALYPWYRNAPLQHDIGDKFLKSTGLIFTERPQKPQEPNGVIRTFPKRIKTIKEHANVLSPRNDIHAPNNKNVESVKDVGAGYVVKRNGSTTWVAKTLMSNATAATLASAPSTGNIYGNKSMKAINGARVTPDSTECFEYLQTKICQAGALCKYKHIGQNEHQRVKFCRRFMNGFCRNGNNCALGSHALLRHQLPVCGFYLRASCPYVEGCTFLHVKNSAKSPFCIHFNKGKCLAEFPCVFIHRYCPAIIRERCNNETDEEMMDSTEEQQIRRFDDIPLLEWFEC